ncbi:MAG: (Fe-S)-binding protein [Theionarchaea archaeon]|nr:(Fe-S)-binding protein [Theionarchaea archaeon]
MLENYVSDIYACARCGDCRESVKLESAHRGVYKVCPIKDQLGFDSYTARGKLMVLRNALEGKEINEDVSDLFYTCLEGGNCTEVCISQIGEGIDIPSIIEDFRSILSEKGFTRKTPEGVEKLMSCKTKEEYLTMYKYLYKETDHLDFEVKTNMFTMARKGYVSWAKKTGLLSIQKVII